MCTHARDRYVRKGSTAKISWKYAQRHFARPRKNLQPRIMTFTRNCSLPLSSLHFDNASAIVDVRCHCRRSTTEGTSQSTSLRLCFETSAPMRLPDTPRPFDLYPASPLVHLFEVSVISPSVDNPMHDHAIGSCRR